MKTVLLAIDDIQQRTFLHTFIMKFGVNVDYITDMKMIEGELVKKMPDLIIVSVNGSTGVGEEALQEVVQKDNTPPVVVLMKGRAAASIKGVDVVLSNTPLNIMDFVDSLILGLNLNKEKTYERLHSIQSSVSSSVSKKEKESKIVSIEERSLSQLNIYSKKHSKNIYLNPEKEEKYKKVLSSIPEDEPAADKKFDRKAIIENNKETRFKAKDRSPEDLDQEKEEFLVSLLTRMKTK